MEELDLKDFNERWLSAWSAKDIPTLLRFYAENVVYKDPQVPNGVTGLADLAAHLEKQFASSPPWEFIADEIWPTSAGYCGRWYCTMRIPGALPRHLRGFDLVVLNGDKIAINEVYVHEVAKAASSV